MGRRPKLLRMRKEREKTRGKLEGKISDQ